MLEKMRDNAQSWGIKVLFAIIVLAFIFAFSMPSDNTEAVMAKVGEDIIDINDFKQNQPQNANQDPRIKQAVLFEMINRLLFKQFAAEVGISVSDAELANSIKRMPEFQSDNVFDSAKYKRVHGNNAGAFEAQQRQFMVLTKINQYAALPAAPTDAEARSLFQWLNEQAVLEYYVVDAMHYAGEVEVDEIEVKEFYDANAQQFLNPAKVELEYIAFTPAALAPSQKISEEEIVEYYDTLGSMLITEKNFSFRHILLPVGENPTEQIVEKRQADLEVILTALQDGKDFAGLAKTYALDDDSAPGEPLTMNPNEMPRELAQALLTLDKGEVSELIITRSGFNLVQLVDVVEPRRMTLDEARPIIAERLAQEKAAKVLGDLLEETMAQMNQGVDLPVIAENLGLGVKTTDPMTRTELEEEFGLNAEAADTLAQLINGTTTKTPLKIGNGGYLLARKVGELPEAMLPMEAVQQRIVIQLRALKARELAFEEAQELLVQASKGEGDLLATAEAAMQTTDPFVRNGTIANLQADPAITVDAFTVLPGSWLPTAYAGQNGFIVARLKETVPAPQEQWEAQRQGLLSSAMEIYRREMYDSLSSSLFQRADEQGAIQLLRPDQLN